MDALWETPRTRRPGPPPMHILDGGPLIPGTVLDAQEAGRLVFFCGAGVSFPNGLTLFSGLVRRVWQRFESVDIEKVLRKAKGKESKTKDSEGSAAKKPFDQALDQLGDRKFSDILASMLDDSYDRAMSCLERHYGAKEVREIVQQILLDPTDLDLGTHEALLSLATTNQDDLQLVTTNFDHLFEEAKPDVRRCAAPTLLVPKPGKWDALVYLHGRIDGPGDPEGNHLVLNSADFGTAYLTERWASRFLSELFRNFTVVFIGYSLNDPVMRYLVDALAADRELSKEFAREAFALVPHRNDTVFEEIEAEWKGKNVTPIPYHVPVSPDGSEDHSLLHDTLRQWAQLWSGGLNARKNLAYELGRWRLFANGTMRFQY